MISKIAAIAALALIGPLGGIATAHAASAAPTTVPVNSTMDCTLDTTETVDSSIDYLRVHTDPGVDQPAVGQVPGGSEFRFCSSSATTTADGWSWVYGTGTADDGTALWGWVAEGYLRY
jgi:hypothetical protein